jgi:glycerophosphoryl diester phosphodiesterase
VRRAQVAGNEPVCRLDHLLEELPTAKFNVDVKADSAVQPVIDLLRRTNAWDRVCLASFSEERLNRLRRLGGERLLTGIGSRSAIALRMRAWAPWLVTRPPVRGCVAQLPVRHGRIRVVDAGLVRYAHRRGIEVHAWTVNSPAQMIELLDLGVDGLVTDRPDALRDVLRERGAWAAG